MQTQGKKKTLTYTVATLKEEDTDREKESIFLFIKKKMNKEEDIPVG